MAQPGKSHCTMWCRGNGADSALKKVLKLMIVEQLRDKALKLCADHGITAQPYAGGWWLVGEKINRVVGELAGLSASDIAPLPMMAR